MENTPPVSSTPQLPFKIPQIPSNRDDKALNSWSRALEPEGRLLVSILYYSILYCTIPYVTCLYVYIFINVDLTIQYHTENIPYYVHIWFLWGPSVEEVRLQRGFRGVEGELHRRPQLQLLPQGCGSKAASGGEFLKRGSPH